MASSRPTRSENQPQKILPPPLATRLQESAATMAAAGMARLLPTGEAWAVIIRSANGGEHERGIQHPEMGCRHHLPTVKFFRITPDPRRDRFLCRG